MAVGGGQLSILVGQHSALETVGTSNRAKFGGLFSSVGISVPEFISCLANELGSKLP